MADEQERRPPPSGSRRQDRPSPNGWVLAGAGLELAGAVAGFVLIGWWLDGKFGTEPWLLVTGLAFGLIGGMYNLWRLGKRFF